MLSREERILGEILVSRGIVDRATVESCAREIQTGRAGASFADLIVETGAADRALLARAEAEAKDLDRALAPVLPKSGKLGEFRLIREIGRGAMGIVYEAEQEPLGRRVALKLLPAIAALDERRVLRFLREARAAARLYHPGIVPVHASGIAEGVLYFAMELIEGETVADAIARGPLSAARAAAIATEVARALAHAHEAGLVHRDVKPENILLGRDGRARVADFGLVQDSIEGSLTLSSHVLGTPAYLSPEQALGKEVDARADVYALGAVLYTMLCGEPPYRGEIPSAVIGKLLHEGPPPLEDRKPDLPPELASICRRAMARDPAERYQSAGSMAEALDSFLATGPQRQAQESSRALREVGPGRESRALREVGPGREPRGVEPGGTPRGAESGREPRGVESGGTLQGGEELSQAPQLEEPRRAPPGEESHAPQLEEPRRAPRGEEPSGTPRASEAGLATQWEEPGRLPGSASPRRSAVLFALFAAAVLVGIGWLLFAPVRTAHDGRGSARPAADSSSGPRSGLASPEPRSSAEAPLGVARSPAAPSSGLVSTGIGSPSNSPSEAGPSSDSGSSAGSAQRSGATALVVPTKGEECCERPGSAGCEKLDLDLGTGVDDSARSPGPIPAGRNDDDWWVTVDPNGSPVPRLALVVTPHARWRELPGGRWISANMFGRNGVYVYETCFCVGRGVHNPILGIGFSGDDFVTAVRLNGRPLTMPPSPRSCIYEDDPCQIMMTDASRLVEGRNCLEIEVTNAGGSPTGLVVSANVRGDY